MILEKKISEMMDYIQDDSVELQTKDIVSSERIKEVTMKKIAAKSKVNKRKQMISRMARTVATIMLLSGVTVYAYMGFIKYENPKEMLEAFFGGETSSEGLIEYDTEGKLIANVPAWERVPVDETLAEELISPYISGETASVSYRGYTLTAIANLYDKNTGSGLVYYTLENPDGISGYVVRPNGVIWWNPETISVFAKTNQAGQIYIDEKQSTETQLYLCEYYIVSQQQDSPEVSLELGEYADYGKVKERIELHPAVENDIYGINLENNSIVISPISLKVDKKACGFGIEDDIDYISLQYADGTQYLLEDDAGFVSNVMYALDMNDTCIYMFNRIVDIHNLVSVTIGDTVYEIN